MVCDLRSNGSNKAMYDISEQILHNIFCNISEKKTIDFATVNLLAGTIHVLKTVSRMCWAT